MTVKWTTEQQYAIDASGSNILVSAAAGSGKTAVLVERVVKMITDEASPVPIDKLLVVTFTNAAAAEMKARISRSLSDLIKEHPDNSNLKYQLSQLPTAKICTIDSFCINLVRENFFKLDIAQDFTILDNAQQLLLEQNAAEEIVEQLYEEGGDGFKALVELLSKPKNDDDLIDAVKRVYTYLSAQPFPEDWLYSAAELYNPDIEFTKSKIYKLFNDELLKRVGFALRMVEESQNALDSNDEMYDKYAELLESDLAIVDTLYKLISGDRNELIKYYNSIVFDKLPRSKKGYTSYQKDVIKSNRDFYKKIINGLGDFINLTEKDFREDNAYLYPLLHQFADLIGRYSSRLLEMKTELGAYSFADLEHFAIELLFRKDEDGSVVRTALAEELMEEYAEILVDEYQDTNAAQDMLFKMLSNGRNRFMVGDVKQSIYRFRLAMPQIFTGKKNRYLPYSDNSDAQNQKIILAQNFRSRDGICGFTNFVFSNLMSESVGELDYTVEEYLNPGATYPASDTPCAQLRLLNADDSEDLTEAEARYVAQMILQKINSREQVKKSDTETRDMRYGDIAVLLRSTKNRMPVFTKIFTEYSIPCVANNRVNLFENNEVVILLSLLRVIDNPVQDVPLLATLMSVFYGYTADEIAAAKLRVKGRSLYASISSDEAHFGRFLNDLNRYREYASSMSVESLIRQIISDTSYLSVIAAMGNYEQRQLNVMKIVELAKAYDRGESVGLTAFMRYIDSVREAELEVESADTVSAGEDCVKLMSVHKSKGLEFPVVILAGTAHRYNYTDLSDSVLLNAELGIGLRVNVEEQLYRYNSAQYIGIKNQNLYELMSENLRVLYVAVTRAKEQFIATAAYRSAQEHIGRLSAKIVNSNIYPEVVRDISCDADLLLLCAMLHPDCEEIRACCTKKIAPLDNVLFRLDAQLVTGGDEAEYFIREYGEADADVVNAIADKLSFSYAGSELSGFAAKRTASSLDETDRGFRYFGKKVPAFMASDDMTAAEKGTAMHTFMQFCDYQAAKVDLEAEIERLKSAGNLTKQQADSLNREKLSAFFNSKLATRMFGSKALYRELKLSSFLPLNEIENTTHTDSVLVQGIADCVFEEDGALVLVDYKTDFVTNEDELLDLYRKQLAFYKKAVEKTLGLPVKESMLYSFCLSKPCIYK